MARALARIDGLVIIIIETTNPKFIKQKLSRPQTLIYRTKKTKKNVTVKKQSHAPRHITLFTFVISGRPQISVTLRYLCFPLIHTSTHQILCFKAFHYSDHRTPVLTAMFSFCLFKSHLCI